MGIFGPNATPNIQPILRQAERANPDSKRQPKDQKKEEEKPKQPPRAADSVQLDGGKQSSAIVSKPVPAKAPAKGIDFSA